MVEQDAPEVVPVQIRVNFGQIFAEKVQRALSKNHSTEAFVVCIWHNYQILCQISCTVSKIKVKFLSCLSVKLTYDIKGGFLRNNCNLFYRHLLFKRSWIENTNVHLLMSKDGVSIFANPLLDVQCFLILHHFNCIWTFCQYPALEERHDVFSSQAIQFCCLFKTAHKLFEGRIFVGKFVNIKLNALLENLASEGVISESDPRGSFTIRDVIEGIFSVSRMIDWHLNTVRRRLQISCETSHQKLKVNHFVIGEAVFEKVALGEANACTKVSKGLFKPQIVPPLHCDEISEPHVCQFVHNDLPVQHLSLFGVIFGVQNHTIRQTDHTNIFHASYAKLRHVNLIIFGPRKFAVKQGLVVLDRIVDYLKLESGVDAFEFGSSTVDFHGCFQFHVSFRFNCDEFASHEPINVGTYRWGFLEFKQLHIFAIFVEQKPEAILFFFESFTNILVAQVSVETIFAICDENPVLTGR